MPQALKLVQIGGGVGCLCCVQGILGVFLREPLADWQREARLLRASFRARGGEPAPDEDTHVALKVLHLIPQSLFRLPTVTLLAACLSSDTAACAEQHGRCVVSKIVW